MPRRRAIWVLVCPAASRCSRSFCRGSGRTLTVADIAADPLLSPEESAAYAWLGIATLWSLPLLEGSRFAANLNLYACRPRQRTDNAIGLVEEAPTRPGGGRARRAENARRD
jgi:GAF domain-containing protein